jgi:hypothetical protein
VSLSPHQLDVLFASDVDPNTMPNSDYLEVWHYVGQGLEIAKQLRPSGANPAISMDRTLNANAGLTVKAETTGTRGVAQVSVFDDGGTTPIPGLDHILSAAFIYVPKYDRTLSLAAGTYTSGDLWWGVCASLAAQSFRPSVLSNLLSDANKPIIRWNSQNGRPALEANGANSRMLDDTSDVANRIMSGDDKEATMFFVAKSGTATPASVNYLFALANSSLGNPLWGFALRNSTNLWRMQKTDDAALSALSDQGALDTSWHVFCVLTRLVGGVPKVTLYIDGVLAGTADVTANVATTTLNNMSWFGACRGGTGATGGFPNPGAMGEVVAYSKAFSTSERNLVEAWLKDRWGTP